MRILLIEDEAALADLTAAGLRSAGFAVDLAGTLADADAALDFAEYDAIVLDLGLPDGDGLTWLAAHRRRQDHRPVLVMTARDVVADRVRALDGGCDDYLVKPVALPELAARLRALLRRPARIAEDVLSLGNLRFSLAGRRAMVDDQDLSLSRRELDLLESLMRHAGNVVARERLETLLYGMEEPVGSNTLEVLVHRLRRKLSQAGAGAEILTLRGVGYMLHG